MPDDEQKSRSSLRWLVTVSVTLLVILLLAVFKLTAPTRQDALGDSRTADLESISKAIAAIDSYVQTDRLGEADRIVAALARQYPDDTDVLRKLAEVRLHQERHEDAYPTMMRLTELLPDDAQIWFSAGVVANMIGKLADSAKNLQQAVRIEPTNPQYPLTLAMIQLKLRDYDQAKIYLLATINLDPSIHQAQGTMGEIYLIENKLQLAEQYLVRARELAPRYLKWRVAQAKVLRRRNQAQQALTLLNALEPPERHAQQVVDEIAMCWAMLGAPRKAAQEHIDHLNRDDTAWHSAVAAALHLITAGDRQAARRWLGFAQRLEPDAPEVKRLAEQLEP